MIIFEILLIANGMMIFLYILFHLFHHRNVEKKQLQRADVWMKIVVMFLCPLVGAAVFFFGFLLQKILYRNPVDLEDVIFSKERVKTYTYADEEQERNLVPIEDAIAVTDTDNLRNLMMNVVRGNIQESLASIAMALDSEDSETSHYAAAVLQEALDKFRGNVQKAYQIIREDEVNHIPYAKAIFDSMNPVLRQNVFTMLEQESMVHLMDEIGDIIYENKPRELSSEQMEAVALRLLDISDYDNCRKWCERQDYHYPEELATYTCELKLYFNTGKRRKFFRVLEELKNSDIVVDSETLELIRVFM